MYACIKFVIVLDVANFQNLIYLGVICFSCAEKAVVSKVVLVFSPRPGLLSRYFPHIDYELIQAENHPYPVGKEVEGKVLENQR